MCNAELIPLILGYIQKNDEDKFTKIYQVFEKLIACYGYRLEYEDGVQEMNVFLLELLFRLPMDNFEADHTSELQKYIAVCLRNQYIALSKRQQLHQATFVELCEEIAGYLPEFEDNTILNNALSKLNSKQKQIISGQIFIWI